MTKEKKLLTAFQKEQGVILIMSLIIMSVLLSTALGFAIFIFSDIRQARSVDNSVLAYYAADAGLERSLFMLRKNGVTWVGQPNDPQPGTLLKILGRDDFVLKNDARWNLAGSKDYEENFYRQRLANGQSVKVYFLKRTSEARENKTDKVRLEWYKGKKADGTVSDVRLQVIFTQLDPQLKYDPEVDDSPVVVYYTDQSPQPLFSDSSVMEKIEYPLKDEIVPYCQGSSCNQTPHDYVMEIRALSFDRDNLETSGDYIDSLRVVAYNKDDQVVLDGITNITLKSIGTYRGSQQEIVAYLPPRDPLSGLLGFVLFSEEDITKSY
ncbi:MAG: hypothetical protein WC518_00430 [Patescibacteria group bacterium]